MFSLSPERITDYALYSSLVLAVFLLARTFNATPALALCLSIIPVVVAWALTNTTMQAMLSGFTG